MPPQWFQEAPGRVQDDSKMPERVPKSLLDTSTGLQDASESTQNASKRRPGGPQRSPSALQEALCSMRSAKRHARKTGLWTKLVQAYGQHHSTSLCNFCMVD